MKAKFKEKKVFKPFDIVITIESEDDLKELWHRFNISEFAICKGEFKYKTNKYKVSSDKIDRGSLIFFEINEKLEEFGIEE